jgi:hypothetical protein
VPALEPLALCGENGNTQRCPPRATRVGAAPPHPSERPPAPPRVLRA